MLAAVAIIAFAAPAAFTANAMIPRDEAGVTSAKRTQPVLTLVEARKLNATQAKTIKNLNARVKTLAAQNKALKATNASQAGTIASLQRQVWDLTHPVVAGPATTPAPDPDADCRDYALCDPEQDCRIWGNNCSLVQPPAAAPDASQDESATSGSENGNAENSGSEDGSSQGGSDAGNGSGAGSQASLACASLDYETAWGNPGDYDWSC
jgi:hypothetical protein